jgi:hypothetical protein
MESLTISKADIIQQLRLTCKLPELIEQVATRKLIFATAEAEGIVATTEELQATSDRMRFIFGLKDADATWAWMKTNYLSLDDFEEFVQMTILSTKLSEKLFGEKAEAWFAENQVNYMAAVLYEVVIDNEDTAWELYYALKDQEITFFEVAQQHVQDQELRRMGGYKGAVQRRSMKAEITSVVFGAANKQLLKPIITSQGYHLIYVDEILQPTFDEPTRYQIHTDMLQEWSQKRLEMLTIETEINFPC